MYHISFYVSYFILFIYYEIFLSLNASTACLSCFVFFALTPVPVSLIMPLSANASLFHAYRSAIPHQSETKGSASASKWCRSATGHKTEPRGSQIPITLMRSRIRIRNPIKMKTWIHILIKVKSRGCGFESALKQCRSATLILRFLGISSVVEPEPEP